MWNVLIVLTLIGCAMAFTAHYKNWVRLKDDHFTILSGIYYRELPYESLDSVTMVEKLPSMERINGFSAWTTEKGTFKDSLHPDNKVFVYVDNLSLPKIKLVHHDSLLMYLNLSDSTETVQLFETLKNRQLTVKKE